MLILNNENFNIISKYNKRNEYKNIKNILKMIQIKY